LQETDLDLITDAIRLAGRVATSYVGTTAQKWDKPGDAGPVTEADLAVNTALETVLRAARPDYGWLSEETEDSAHRLSQDTVFIIDPIDGTRSFVEGSKTWAHSIAIAHDGEVTAGAVYLPMRDMLFTAKRGGGATLNGKPLTTSLADDLDTASVLATKPSVDPKHWPAGLPGFTYGHRPSLAYRLCLIAQARFDAMMTFRATWEWDIAAGALIVTEAGGKCTDKTGAPLRFNNENPTLNGVLAAGPALHSCVLDALSATTSP
jgi:myo-inositol-1(or 4)-monophosphatase